MDQRDQSRLIIKIVSIKKEKIYGVNSLGGICAIYFMYIPIKYKLDIK